MAIGQMTMYIIGCGEMNIYVSGEVTLTLAVSEVVIPYISGQ